MNCNICDKAILLNETVYCIEIGMFEKDDENAVGFRKASLPDSFMHFNCYQKLKEEMAKKNVN